LSKRKAGSKLVSPSHHDCIKYISEYVHKFNDTPLWVAESDICKFYDSVNHNMIKRSFKGFIKSAKKSYPGLSCLSAIRIFESYLKSYPFVHHSLPLNKDQSFFEKFHIQNGEFEWIDKELNEKHYYKSMYRERIGVPQGGALSGLIANIVLDYADKKVLEFDDGKLLYIRYCDDMILAFYEIGFRC
jgi:retron-type reverse transcriptase